ncbi:MAG: hypothetical protein N2512_04730 [Armatimonadetes bacterium]|nr:hypothetical protein [Armatimonadota bacterium]
MLAVVQALRELLLRYPGQQRIILHFLSPTGRKKCVKLGQRYRVTWVDELVVQLNKLRGVLQTWEEREDLVSGQHVRALRT